ncbi:tellurite resistance TerB family protein [Gellertiella hungarica]|uniref:Uncharacterized membrane protein YebE (DUF533 family) n=1 Tax=Gellertiella hungarica TaxID=1572859 RepID=A0A7W6NJ43_9HYPH|nr:tellurite resistance TerB family protein [Gellertiella hungarica]MBB4063010.1 uncharacterized membrane protein YebE (DUF533 family) [Gellertiella hungarica]
MFDAKQLLDQFLGAPVPGTNGTVKDKATDLTKLAQENPLATGAVAAVLLGTGFGRRLTGEVLKLGGLAAIAGLGYQAYRNWKAGSAPEQDNAPAPGPVLVPPPADSGFSPSSPANSADFALVLVRAMIAAARADGQIDDAERAMILDKIRLSGLGQEAEGFIADELKRPLDLDQLVALAVTEEQKVELYTASRLTINPETRAERGYLDMLAGRLGLPDDLVRHIEATVATANA